MKQLFLKQLLALALFVGIVVIPSETKASHIMGVDISYKCIDTNAGIYVVTVKLYRDCAGIDYGGEQLQVAGCGINTAYPMTLVTKQEVTPLCTPPDVVVKPTTNCPGPNTPPLAPDFIKGVYQVIYTKTVTIGKNCGFVLFGYTNCCRNAAITTIQNPSSNGLWGQAVVNTNYQNNSTVFTTNPVPYWCAGIKNTYNHGAADSFDPAYIYFNGKKVVRDSLVYNLYTPWVGLGAMPGPFLYPPQNNEAIFNSPLNTINFIHTDPQGPVSVDPGSGTITAIPSQLEDAIMAMRVEEWRAVADPSKPSGYTRVLVGYTIRDIQFSIKAYCDPITSKGAIQKYIEGANFLDSVTIDVCDGQKTKIIWKVIGPPNQFLHYKVIQAPNTSDIINYKFKDSINRKNNTDTFWGVMTFDSISHSAVGNSAVLMWQIYYCNSIGIKIVKDFQLTINYQNNIYIPRDTLYICEGNEKQIDIKGGQNYYWTPSTGIVAASGSDSSWIRVKAPAPNTKVVYKGTAKNVTTKTCNIMDSIVVIGIPKFQLTLSDTVKNLCLNDSLLVNTSVFPSIDTPYTYVWKNSLGTLFGRTSRRASDTIKSPLLRAMGTNLYTLEATNKYECVVTRNMQINVIGVKPNASAYSFRPLVCPGDTTMLNIRMKPLTCGLTMYSCNPSGVLTTSKLESVNSNDFPLACNPATPSTCYPNIYGVGSNSNSSTTRILFTKAQLDASGIKPGIIKSMTFYISSRGQQNISEFSIKMGCTSSSDVRNDLILYPVYSTKAITCVLGANKYTFDRGYDWDGVSNIIVEICSYNPTYSGTNTMSTFDITTSTPNQVAYRVSSTAGIRSCDLTSAWTVAGNFAGTKPVVSFEYCSVDSTSANMSAIWNPSSIVNVSSPASLAADKGIRGIATIPSDINFIATIGTGICTDTALVTVKVDTSFTAKATGDTVLCRTGAAPVTLPVNVTSPGGMAGKTIVWTVVPSTGVNISNASISNPTISITNSGKYKAIVTVSQLPCSTIDTVDLEVNDSLNVSMSIDSPICNSPNGKLKVNLPGGKTRSSFTFTWTPSVSTIDTTTKTLPTGNYSCLVTLKSDPTCKGTATANVQAIVIPLLMSINTSPILCHGGTADTLGAVVATNTSSPGPYSYAWTPTSTGRVKSNVVAGTYSVTATDQNTQCTGTATTTITEPTTLVASISHIDVTCFNKKNGSISVNASGGTGILQYQWSTNAATGNLFFATNLDVGVYSCTVSDQNGCSVVVTDTIKQPQALALQLDSVKATVVNGTDGQVIATFSGGTAPYTINWFKSPIVPKGTVNPATSPAVLNGLNKGLYYAILTDNNGCFIRDTTEVFDIICKYDTLINRTNILCFDNATGIIEIGVKDTNSQNIPTTNLYTYNLTGTSTQTLTSVNGLPNTVSFTGLIAGIYNVQVTTNLGCDQTYSFNLTQNAKMQFDRPDSKAASCDKYKDGKALVQVVSGGVAPYKIKFADGDSTNYSVFGSSRWNSGLDSGTHKSYIVDSKNCLDSFYYQVTDPSGITVSVLQTDVVHCHSDDSAKIKVTYSVVDPSNFPARYYLTQKPGYNDSTSGVFKNLKAGTYTGEVHFFTSPDSTARCIANFGISISQPDTLIITSVVVDSVKCYRSKDARVTITKTGGRSPYINRLVGGVGNIDVSQSSDVFNPTFIKNVIDTGAYIVYTTDNNGWCKDSAFIRVAEPAEFKVSIDKVNAHCIESKDGSISVITYQGGNGPTYSYVWLDVNNNVLPNSVNNPTINNLEGPKTYIVNVFDNKTCPAIARINVDADYVLRLANPKMDSVTCFGGSDGKATILAGSWTPSNVSITNYNWSNGTILNPLTTGAGVYTVTVEDNNHCTASNSVKIEEPSDIVLVAKTKDVTCFGGDDGTIKVVASGGVPSYTSYVWSSNAFNQRSDSAVDLKAGVYTITVTDSKGCIKTQNYTILQPDTFYVYVKDKQDITCFGAKDGSIKVTVVNGEPSYSYRWNIASADTNFINYLGPNPSYQVTVTDSKGCTVTTSTEIKEPTKLEFEELKVDSISCPNYKDGIIDITVKGGTISSTNLYSYSIDGGVTYYSNGKFPNLPKGIYTVNVKDVNNCLVTRKVEVGSPEELKIDALKLSPTTDTIDMGASALLSINKSTFSGVMPKINSILWSPNYGLSCVDCEKTYATPYATQPYTVEVRYHNNCLAKSKITVFVKEPLDIFVPSAFTPGNGDGLNDIVKIYGNGIKKATFMVFNRWGEKVFESYLIDEGWDGYYKGELAPSDVYSFYAEVEYLNGLKKNKRGSITLIR